MTYSPALDVHFHSFDHRTHTWIAKFNRFNKSRDPIFRQKLDVKLRPVPGFMAAVHLANENFIIRCGPKFISPMYPTPSNEPAPNSPSPYANIPMGQGPRLPTSSLKICLFSLSSETTPGVCPDAACWLQPAGCASLPEDQ
jgi:hypothetical protein